MNAHKQKKLWTSFLKQYQFSNFKKNRWPQSSEFLEQIMIDTFLMKLTQFEYRSKAALRKHLREHDQKQRHQVK